MENLILPISFNEMFEAEVYNCRMPIKKTRTIASTLPLEKRVSSFSEVNLGFAPELAHMEAERCLHCIDAPCMNACPAHIAIPEFIAALKRRDSERARKIIADSSVLPSICSRVCPQEKQCEGACRLGKLGEPIAIGNLERFVCDTTLEPAQAIKRVISEKKVAIVGGGPSGLSAAKILAQEGLRVTIFDKEKEMGGILRYGIPTFVLPRFVLEKELGELRQLGIRFENEKSLGKDFSINSLLQEGYDAVYLAIGAGIARKMDIPGENLRNVFSADRFLREANSLEDPIGTSLHKKFYSKRALIVGGGNVALDAARLARRLGSDVTIVYRREESLMPARRDEIQRAKEEGVKFEFLVTPIAFNGADALQSVTFIKMRLGKKDASGRASPVPIEGSENTIPFDFAITAVGYQTDEVLRKTDELALSPRGTIVIDEKTRRTSIPKVYAGGDAARGPASVVLAMKDGMSAARSIIDDINE